MDTLYRQAFKKARQDVRDLPGNEITKTKILEIFGDAFEEAVEAQEERRAKKRRVEE